MSEGEDQDIEIIKARKMKEMREKAAAFEKAKKSQQIPAEKKTPKEIVAAYLYDRGDEVLNAAYAQYPTQTAAIISKISELILAGELQSKISGGELLSLFRSVGLRVRIDTSIKVEKDGKMISFSERLKQDNEGQ